MSVLLEAVRHKDWLYEDDLQKIKDEILVFKRKG